MEESSGTNLEGAGDAYVYRLDGTLEWCSSSDTKERSMPVFDAIRGRLGEGAYAEIREHGIAAHRLVGARDRAAERCLVVASPVRECPAWLRGVRLTPRRREVAELAAVGATALEIAAHMSISPHTVRQHLKIVYRQLVVANRVELAHALAQMELA